MLKFSCRRAQGATTVRVMGAVFGVLVTLIVLLGVALWLAPQADFQHDPPRDLPWELPDVQLGKTQYHVLEDGRLEISIEHPLLAGITPEMLVWFYQVLPIATVQLDEVRYPLYHLFHPTEHGVVSISEAADNGSPGMGVGALVTRQEWFGPYNSKGSGRILEFGSRGMTVAPEVAGFSVGKIEHRFEASDCGARYTVHSVLGSSTPIIGTLLNLYIRHKQFPAEKIEQWLRHQLEEVGSLPFFLPALYQQKKHPGAAQDYHLNAGSIKVPRGCSGGD